MNPIKTITALMKCLNADIPIFKEVYQIELKVPRMVVYKMSLLELIHAVNHSTFYTKMTKEAIDHYVKVVETSRKEERAAVIVPAKPTVITGVI